jgi:uncharacterized repeat protein (TIGR03803 family)
MTEVVLHNFGGFPRGASPQGGVIRDSAGNLYGTASGGGTSNAGVVYRVDTAGHQKVLYNFTGGANGGGPMAGVIGDSAGNLYGTTQGGGDVSACGGVGCGVVYKLDATGDETVLYTFTGGTDGGMPIAGVIRDAHGNLYGTASEGGATGFGLVYKLDATGHLTVLYNFTGHADGAYPTTGVIRDSAGNLYGTTATGGAFSATHIDGEGVVYKLDAAGQETVLYTFTGGTDGGMPFAVIRDSAGNLYGAAEEGGVGGGVVYKLDTAGQETVLYNFSPGQVPFSGVSRDSAGNLYGTTITYPWNTGTVYQVDTTGNETVLYSFTGGADGGAPKAGVVLDAAGNLYGTTWTGGPANAGVVYKLDVTGDETVLYGFPGGAGGGGNPWGGVIRDSAGNLYGTSSAGGTSNAGIVYKLDAAGREKVLYNFTGGADGGDHGTNPLSGVIGDSAGNLYGTTYYGGTANAGVVYKLDAAGQETVLHSFTGGADGANPWAGVIRDSSGNLYGTTQGGGTASAGVVYKVDTAGNETILYTFTGDGGANPLGGVIRDSAGNLYGTTVTSSTNQGLVYKLDATGQETVLYRFTGGADGAYPSASLIRDSAGNLYGTTQSGGDMRACNGSGCGVVFKLDTTGHETVLYSFTGRADGASPHFAGVTRDSAGNLYGTTVSGGTGNCGISGLLGCGVVFELDTAGNETVLYSFTGGPDGGQPYAGVILDSAGNVYGTTWLGGLDSTGVVFELKPVTAAPAH